MENTTTPGEALGRRMLRFALPYLLAYFLQTVYGMADLFIIGQYQGAAGTTAVAIGSQVMHMITVMLVGLAMGVTVSVGQAAGAGDRPRIGVLVGNTILLFAGCSVVLALGLMAEVGPVVSLMSTPSQAMEGTRTYLLICFVGIPFITAYNVLASIFRGLGDSKRPLYFVAAACAANIGLDYLFIGGLGLGPAGAALGTVLSQGFSVVLALAVLHRSAGMLRLRWEDLRPQRGAMGQILSIGVPVAVQDGLIQVSFLLITIIANRRGLVDAAAVGVVEKIISFLFLVPSSMLSTVSALGAQSIGAGRWEEADRMLRRAIGLGLGFGAVVALGMQGAAPLVLRPFTADAAVVAAGVPYIRGYVFDCLFAGVQFSFSGYFCACGRSELSFLHNILSIVLVRVPGAYLASVLFPDTLLPMGLASAMGSLFSSLVCAVLCHRLRKQGKLTVAR